MLPPAQHFSWCAVHIRWPKYWSFSFSIGPFSEYSRLISLKTDWFDHLPVQGTFRSLFQHHSSRHQLIRILPSYGPALTTVHEHWEDHSLDYTGLTYFFSFLEPVCCSLSSSNCCFLTCIQVSQEADQVVWYAHQYQSFPQFIVIHSEKALA